MSQRTVLVLVLLALLVVGGAWMAGRSAESTAPAGIGQPLLPGVHDHVNDVASLAIVTKTDRFTVRKDPDGWKLVERDGFPARFETVKKTLMALADMTTLEALSSNPERYAKMGVVDPEAKDADSALVTALDASGKSMGAVIIGHNGSVPSSLYARRASEAQSWLVKSNLYLERNVGRWLNTELWKLPSSRVKTVLVQHGDGEKVLVGKGAATDTDWALADVPAGQQVKSSSIGRVLAAALENLSFDNVAAVASKPLPETERVTTTFDTFDGLHVVVTTAKEAAPEPEPAPEGEEPEHPTATWWAQIEVSAGPEAADAVKAEAAADSKKLAPWIFALPEYRASSLRKRMADMTQPIAADAPPSGDEENLPPLIAAPPEGEAPAPDEHAGHDHAGSDEPMPRPDQPAPAPPEPDPKDG